MAPGQEPRQQGGEDSTCQERSFWFSSNLRRKQKRTSRQLQRQFPEAFITCVCLDMHGLLLRRAGSTVVHEQ